MDIDQGGESKQQIIIHIIDTPRSSPVGGQTMASPTSSTTIYIQQQGLQTSTSRPAIEGQEKSVYEIFRELKLKNEVLKTTTYNHFWKHTSCSQSRLLSAFDNEKGRMKMVFLEALVPQPQGEKDYKKASVKFSAKDIHPIDQMLLHK